MMLEKRKRKATTKSPVKETPVKRRKGAASVPVAPKKTSARGKKVKVRDLTGSEEIEAPTATRRLIRALTQRQKKDQVEESEEEVEEAEEVASPKTRKAEDVEEVEEAEEMAATTPKKAKKGSIKAKRKSPKAKKKAFSRPRKKGRKANKGPEVEMEDSGDSEGEQEKEDAVEVATLASPAVMAVSPQAMKMRHEGEKEEGEEDVGMAEPVPKKMRREEMEEEEAAEPVVEESIEETVEVAAPWPEEKSKMRREDKEEEEEAEEEGRRRAKEEGVALTATTMPDAEAPTGEVPEEFMDMIRDEPEAERAGKEELAEQGDTIDEDSAHAENEEAATAEYQRASQEENERLDYEAVERVAKEEAASEEAERFAAAKVKEEMGRAARVSEAVERAATEVQQASEEKAEREAKEAEQEAEQKIIQEAKERVGREAAEQEAAVQVFNNEGGRAVREKETHNSDRPGIDDKEMRREIQLHWEQSRRRTEDEKAVRDRERLQEEMQALEGQEVVLKDKEKKLSVDEQDIREKHAASHARGSHDKADEIAELSQRKEVSIQAAHIEERRLSELEGSLLEPQDPAAEEDDQGRFWGWDGSHAMEGGQPQDPGAHLSLGERCCSERTPSDKRP